MASRNLYLRMSLVTVPVSLQPATTRAKRIRLNMISPDTGTKLEQRLVEPETEQEVPRMEAARGYEFDQGRFVQISPGELAKLEEMKSEAKKVIDIERFLPVDSVPAAYLNSPYYLLPQNDMAGEAYGVIRDALRKTGTVGFGRIVLSTREHAALVQAHAGGLTLTTLRSSDEVRAEPAIFAKPTNGSSAELVAVAEQLIRQRLGAFDPAQCRDRYQDMLQQLIEGKLKALPAAEKVAPEPRATVVNLMDVLKQSIAATADHEAASAKAAKGGEGSMKLPAAGKGRQSAEAKGRAKPASRGGGRA